MLHPRLADPAELAALRDAWRASPNLRIESFLDEEEARALYEAIRRAPHELQLADVEHLPMQYWAFAQVPDADCDHVVCRAGRWFWSDGVALISQITGLALEPPPDRQLVATHYDKGCFLDPHNDFNGSRKIAFVLGLTEESGPVEDGGWLEFLGTAPEKRPPGWNTLDVFDVRSPDRPHAVPIVTRRAERRALSGWFY